jgi:hypothetical protein
MTFRTEPPVALLPPIVEQMASWHVREVGECDCCGKVHRTNTCSCGASWPCDVSRLLTTLWGEDVHERARRQRDARTSEPPW